MRCVFFGSGSSTVHHRISRHVKILVCLPLDSRHARVRLAYWPLSARDRDRGTPRGATPPTPPGIRVTYLGGSIGLSFNAQCRDVAGRESQRRGCAVPFGPPDVLTCARTPSANRRRPRQGTFERLCGVAP